MMEKQNNCKDCRFFNRLSDDSKHGLCLNVDVIISEDDRGIEIHDKKLEVGMIVRLTPIDYDTRLDTPSGTYAIGTISSLVGGAYTIDIISTTPGTFPGISFRIELNSLVV
mgnify:CR=1 FL=1